MKRCDSTRENGSALIVTVLLLVLLSVMGLAALETVQRDQQVAGFQNRSRLAFYAAEAGIADAKNRLRDVWTETATVTFPDETTPVAVGDAALFPLGLPVYYADPASAGGGVEYLDGGAVSYGGGGDLRLGGAMAINTLWRIRVIGETPEGARSRLEVVATRQLEGAGGY